MTQKRDTHKDKLILIVDDDPSLLKFFKIHLNAFHPNVIIAQSVTEALKILDKVNIDLLITDVCMPKGSGIQLLKKVKSKDASIPVVLLSGKYSNQSDPEISHADADGFLAKPFSVDELSDIIQTNLTKREHLIRLKAMSTSNQQLIELRSSAPVKIEYSDKNNKILKMILNSIKKIAS